MNIRVRMKAKLQELNFDFRHFTMEKFVAHIEKLRGKEILFIDWDMPAGLYGAWISDADDPCEYIFYSKSAPPIHQIHIQLHELAHIINDHDTLRVSKTDLEASMNKREDDISLFAHALMRAPNDTEMEQEAEMLATLVQEQALRYVQVQNLKAVVSSSEVVLSQLKSLELI